MYISDNVLYAIYAVLGTIVALAIVFLAMKGKFEGFGVKAQFNKDRNLDSKDKENISADNENLDLEQNIKGPLGTTARNTAKGNIGGKTKQSIE
jgi:hypothetical protein